MQTMSVHQALQLATSHHSAGRFAQAESIYRQILSQDPRQPQALQLLGVLAHQVGQSAAALDLLRQSLAILPDDPDALINITEVLRTLGQLEEAIASGRRATELVPKSAAAWLNFGTALKDAKQYDEASLAFDRAIALEPNYALAFNNLGIVRQNQSRVDEAMVAYKRAIELQPAMHDAWNNLGTAHLESQNLPAAVDAFKQSIALNPKSANAYANLAEALNRCDAFQEAAAIARRAIEIAPDSEEAYVNLATALQGLRQHDAAIDALLQLKGRNIKNDVSNQLGNAYQLAHRYEESERAYLEALGKTPDSPRVLSNLGMLYYRMSRLDDAEARFRRALEIDPDYADARFNLSLLLLHRGDLPRGWEEYEWRGKVPSHLRFQRHTKIARWQGEELKDGVVLLHSEQGLGDAVQMIRYAPMVRARCRRVVLECQRELVELMRSAEGVDEIIPRGQAIPAVDAQLPLLSLPHIFRTDLSNIPDGVPYLKPPADRIELWKQRLLQHTTGSDQAPFRVGLVWAGNPAHHDDRMRSCPPEAFEPLVKTKSIGRGVAFYSLQKGHGEAGMPRLPAGLQIEDLAPQITDFADTAAILMNLDLLICVDTAPAHLAGALGRPVWMMLSARGEWRWLLARTDSPWYPTMRLFRQIATAKTSGGAVETGAANASAGWSELMERLATALTEQLS